ncbi:MAG: hypothetical protein MJB14_19650 [Spirochaetes bacterium]|nr:hypothetical protein [Spirochaetota bacterium]
MKKSLIMIVLFVLVILNTCKKDSSEQAKTGEDTEGMIISGKTYQIPIVYDGKVPRDSFDDVVEGFTKRMDELLASYGAKGEYPILYVMMTDDRKSIEGDRVDEVVEKIEQMKPELICNINSPAIFVDKKIVHRLPDFKFVSENCIPEKSGIINSWEKPGGNITGVGVFLQFNSPIKLMKRVDPKFNKVVSYSWDAVGPLNDWYESEMIKACKEEGVELVGFFRIKSYEEEFELLKKYDVKGGGYFIIPGISSRVDKNGNPVDMTRMLPEFLIKNIKYTPHITYDESVVRNAAAMGACVVWYDIGQQLADKGIKVLQGEDISEMKWEYPRKFNIVLNKMRAESINLPIPEEVVSAAYKIYLNYDGDYIGQN